MGWGGEAGIQSEAAACGEAAGRPLGGALPPGSLPPQRPVGHSPGAPHPHGSLGLGSGVPLGHPSASDRVRSAPPEPPQGPHLTDAPSSEAPFPDLRPRHALPEALPPRVSLEESHPPDTAPPPPPQEAPAWLSPEVGLPHEVSLAGQGRGCDCSGGTGQSACTRPGTGPSSTCPAHAVPSPHAAASPLTPQFRLPSHQPLPLPPHRAPPLSRLAGPALPPFPDPFPVSQPLPAQKDVALSWRTPRAPVLLQLPWLIREAWLASAEATARQAHLR